MKRLGLIFLLLLGMAVSMQAQDITGKWKCSKEILDRLNLGYEDISGHYTFYKNGKFKLRIKGRKRTLRSSVGVDHIESKPYRIHSQQRTISIKASGRYVINDGRITTKIRPKKVKVYVDIDRNPPRPLNMDSSSYEMIRHDYQERRYNNS